MGKLRKCKPQSKQRQQKLDPLACYGNVFSLLPRVGAITLPLNSFPTIYVATSNISN